jgi:hypothetical protein
VRDVEIVLQLETRGRDHVADIIRKLEACQMQVREQT